MAISEERRQVEKELRKVEEERLAIKREKERIQFEKEKAELERQRRELEERQRKDREEQVRKEKEQKEQQQAAEQKALEKQVLAEKERENESSEQQSARDTDSTIVNQQQEQRARQRVLDVVKKRVEREKEQNANTVAASENSAIRVSEADAEQNYFHRIILYIKSDLLQPVAANKELKSYCSSGKRKIKPKLGQLTNSQSQIFKIIKEIGDVLEASKSNDLCYRWLLNAVAKAIVSQAETETSVSIMSAYPLGTVGLFLMSRHPLLLDLLIARIVKKCPYVIGFNCSIDTEEGRIKMGYKRDTDNKWEDDGQYGERMSGIAAVWSVMTSVGFPIGRGAIHPYPLYHSWTFISRTLNIAPANLTNVHFAVIASWWEIVSQRFLDAYGIQGHKMLNLAWDKCTVAVSDKRYPAAARLRIMGEQWLKTGKTGLERPREV
ncbi:GLE1-like protein-domain-containing protein [Lipomyces arxii]|uniref:GLE1-like protein-domain-containing protein n=1 Tax=Lipomyces arxii TaxID=56418 RepID=UPI0034CF0229